MVFIPFEDFGEIYKDDSATRIGDKVDFNGNGVMDVRYLDSTGQIVISGKETVGVKLFELESGVICSKGCSVCTSENSPTGCSSCLEGFSFHSSNNSCPVTCDLSSGKWRDYTN